MIGEPKITVECDKCGEREDLDMCSLAMRGCWDTRLVKSQLKQMGWTGDESSDEHLCPDCKGEEGRAE